MERYHEPTVMIPFEKALEIVIDAARPLGAETVALNRARGRYLAGPLRARWPLPRFAQSAMDGFAVRAADLAGASASRPVTLALAGEMAAGAARRSTLRAGQTVKVFTGGRLPRGADSVVMQEDVACEDGGARFASPASPGDHVRGVGDEVRRGDELLPAGARITPPVVGLLAAMGLTAVRVGRTPTVTVIATGDELVPPGERLTAGRIHDANGPALRAALQELGVTRVRLRRVRDDIASLVRSLSAALASSDVVITVGGASVGDHDHVVAARSALEIEALFRRVAVKPGKPNIFGRAPSGVPVFSLPGNPASALVSFHQLVKPLLGIMMGAGVRRGRTVPVSLRETRVKKPGRAHWLSGRLARTADGLAAELATAQASHMLSGLAAADILAELPAASTRVKTEETVRAWLLDWDEC